MICHYTNFILVLISFQFWSQTQALDVYCTRRTVS